MHSARGSSRLTDIRGRWTRQYRERKSTEQEVCASAAKGVRPGAPRCLFFSFRQSSQSRSHDGSKVFVQEQLKQKKSLLGENCSEGGGRATRRSRSFSWRAWSTPVCPRRFCSPRALVPPPLCPLLVPADRSRERTLPLDTFPTQQRRPHEPLETQIVSALLTDSLFGSSPFDHLDHLPPFPTPRLPL